MATPNIVPRADSEGQLGTSSKYWGAAYIDLIYVGGGKVGRDADNNLDFSTDNNIYFKINGSNELALDSGQLYPETNNGLSLGAAGRGFSDLFLASGAVVNFDNGNVTLTHSSGALTSSGHIVIDDSKRLKFGGGHDLEIYHDTSNSYITQQGTGNLYISNSTVDKDIIFQADNGSGTATPYLTLDGGYSTPQVIIPDNVALVVGTGLDFSIIHNGSNTALTNNTGDLTIINNQDNGDIIFKTSTSSDAAAEYFRLDGGQARTEFVKATQHADNAIANFGSSSDLKIYHNGTDSYVLNGTGDLEIISNKQDKDIIFKGDDGQASDNTVATYFYLDGSSAAHDGSATTALYTNWPDNSYISLGTSHDLQIVHTGVNSVIQNLVGKLQILSFTDDIEIKQFADDKDIILSSDDGSGGVTPYLTLDGTWKEAKFTVDAKWTDSKKARFGDGDDLQIFHDSTNSYINNNTGDLKIRNLADGKDIVFESDNGSGGATEYFRLDGSNAGFTTFPDNTHLAIGTDRDFRMSFDGTNATLANHTGDITIKNNADDGDIIFQTDPGDGGNPVTYLALDGGLSRIQVYKRLQLQDSIAVYLGTGSDDFLYHNGSNSFWTHQTGDLTIESNQDDGNIIFKNDDGSGGTAEYFKIDGEYEVNRFLKNARFNDGVKANFGTVDDLQIYHNGTHSYIDDTGTGKLILRGSDAIELHKYTGEYMITAVADGAVSLYYDDSKKLETKSDGVDITGELQCDTLDVDGNADILGVLNFSKTNVDAESSENFYRIKFNDVGGVHNDVGIGQNASNNLGFNITAGGNFTFNNGTSGNVLTLTGSVSTFKSPLTVGVDDTGHDVKFYGATAGSFLLWDESDDSLNLTDSTKLKIGDSADLQIYHDGSHSYIEDTGTGRLRLKSSSQIDFLGANGESMANMIENGAVKLYHNNVQKLETTSAGVTVGGSVIISDDGNIGSSSDPDAISIDDSGKVGFSGDGIEVTGKSTLTAREFPLANGTDGNHTGDVVYFGSTTSMTAGKIYYYKSDGTWALADADSVSTADGLLGVALGAASNTNGMLLRGMVTLAADTGDVADPIYLHVAAGDASSTAPTGSGDIVRVLGYCLHATNGNVWFNPAGTFITIA